MIDELYTVDEVAEILRTTPNTIYRWLRAGKLPGAKIGKEWRIKREAINAKLAEHNIAETEEDLWDKIDFQHSHVLAITFDEEELYDLEVVFFKKGLKKNYRLFKGCWWQKPNEVRKEYTARGLPVEKLENNNLLQIVDLGLRYNQYGIPGVINTWVKEAEKAIQLGQKALWGSAAPHTLSCQNDFKNLLELEATLEKTLDLYPVVGICPYTFQDLKNHDYRQILELIKHHKNIVFKDETEDILLTKDELE